MLINEVIEVLAGNTSSGSGNRMMFVHDSPFSVNLAEAHGEAEFQIHGFTATQVAACPDRGRKSHIGARRDADVAKIEAYRLRLPFEEHLPGRHVGVQSARQEGRRHIEHQEFGVMVGADSGEVLIAYSL